MWYMYILLCIHVGAAQKSFLSPFRICYILHKLRPVSKLSHKRMSWSECMCQRTQLSAYDMKLVQNSILCLFMRVLRLHGLYHTMHSTHSKRDSIRNEEKRCAHISQLRCCCLFTATVRHTQTAVQTSEQTKIYINALVPLPRFQLTLICFQSFLRRKRRNKRKIANRETMNELEKKERRTVKEKETGGKRAGANAKAID